MPQGWMVKCIHCGQYFDSHDSYSDSYEMLYAHIELDHPDQNSR